MSDVSPEVNATTDSMVELIGHILSFNRRNSQHFQQRMDTFLLELTAEVLEACRAGEVWVPQG